ARCRAPPRAAARSPPPDPASCPGRRRPRARRGGASGADPPGRSADPRRAARGAGPAPARGPARRPRPAPAAPLLFPDPLQHLVGAAAAEALQVERHVEIAELAEAPDDRPVPILFPEARHLLRDQLEAGQPVVMAHPELAEAQAPHEGLGVVDAPELLGGDRIAVLEARRQAREG